MPTIHEFRMLAKNLFIILVDRIFTSLFGHPFTKLFDVANAKPEIACVYRACNAD